ncbi:hypothetical protein BC826DRAFT_1092279 [Russula brevipes]|nr:hypothetical protein BC826DRAFT_1092279 [Russula brevipes]
MKGPFNFKRRCHSANSHIQADVRIYNGEDIDVSSDDVHNAHEQKTAPLLTRGAYRVEKIQRAIGQYGVFGTIVESGLSLAQSPLTTSDSDSTRLYLNTNTPLSALVCGVQGSGKSHTVSVILENMFVTGCRALGRLVKPLSGLVLHVGETGACAAPCEAAYVSVSVIDNAEAPPVRVYVAPSSLGRMKKVYGRLGDNLEVKPFYFSESELDAAAFLSLMAVHSSDNAPLYVQTVLSVLREMGEKYTYATGRAICPWGDHDNDLSDPFVDPAMAGAIFEICIRLFQRASVDTGKVLVVDEAHKYLSETNTSAPLTQALLSLVRQQRHMSMRVIVSTQEPTVLPSAFLALCSTIILHRFASPAWWEHLKKHISQRSDSVAGSAAAGSSAELMQFSRNFIIARTRKRVTADGGTSVMVV